MAERERDERAGQAGGAQVTGAGDREAAAVDRPGGDRSAGNRPAAGERAADLEARRARILAWLRGEAGRGQRFRELAQAVCSRLYR
ncbi:MAG TPA: hypothetical protein VIL40_02735, partial [Thermaerobacter sp.]